MNCMRFEELLFDWLDGELDTPHSDAMVAHMGDCERCSALHALASEDADGLLAAPENLLGDIMSASGVDACGRARQRLVEHEGAGLDTLDPVLAMHAESCAECGALHRALRALREDLPRLAELEPDADFLESVMQATVAAPRLADWWQRLLGRPRLALEGAYVGTLILALTFVTPAAAFTQVPARVLKELREDRIGVRATVVEGWDSLAEAGAGGWEKVTGEVSTYVGETLPDRFEGIEVRLRPWGEWLTSRWDEFRAWLIDPILERMREIAGSFEWPGSEGTGDERETGSNEGDGDD